jgi:hypothetical protein
VENTDTAAGLLAKVDEGITGRALISLQFHSLVTPATQTTEFTPTEFQTFIDGIAARVAAGTLRVATVPELFSNPAVPVPKVSRSVGSNAATVAGAVGTSTRYARADHVHTRGVWLPNDHGLISWAYDPATAAGVILLPAAGTAYVIRLHVPSGVPAIAAAHLYATTGGSSLVSGQCFAALYNSAKALIGTSADQSTAWATSGAKTMALTPASAGSLTNPAAGDYLLAYWANTSAGALPTFLRQCGVAACNTALTGETSRYATADTGLTTTPPSSLGALTAYNVATWGGLS